MSIKFTSIHAALGSSDPLDFDLINQAIGQGLREDDRLDWKRELPDDGDELAKDVAAMANSRGGILVYGVAEVRGAAGRAAPVDVTDGAQRRVISRLSTRINPRIPGLQIFPCPGPDDPAQGFLVVAVPESPDSPHLVGGENKTGVPYRHGTQTFWMREWDLERAYRERFARRTSDESRLEELIDHLGDKLDLDACCWLVAATRPTITAAGDPPDKAAIKEIFTKALETTANITSSTWRYEVLGELVGGSAYPRVGLRRWVLAETFPSGSLSNGAHVELHHDGSITFAARVQAPKPAPADGRHAITVGTISGFSADLVALIHATATARGTTGLTLARVKLLRPDDSPLVLMSVRDGLDLTPGTDEVRRFLPVDAVIPRSDSTGQLHEAALMIAADITSQFGHRLTNLGF